jgi:hypothetical protein
VRQLRVLVGCEHSGRVRDEFARHGWEAWSADLLPTESREFDYLGGGFGCHYQGDVRDLFDWRHPVNEKRLWQQQLDISLPLWDLAILHPPCDHLAYAGAVWFKVKDATRGGDGRMQQGAAFFMEMVDAPSPLVAVENPHGVMQKLYRPPTQSVQPWMFGDAFVKRTDLWLKGLPPLAADRAQEDYPELFRVATGGGSWRTDTAAARRAMNAHEDSEGRANRAKVRSRTLPGLARAMAEQWTAFALDYYRSNGTTGRPTTAA